MAKIVKKAKATVSKKAVAAPKKGTAKKSAPVKAKKAAPKPAAKKAPVKVVKSKAKTVAKKTVAKKVVSKAKTVAKKAPAKKAVVNKAVTKKSAAKKVVTKSKPVAKKAVTAKKADKKVVAKSKKVISKPVVIKKAPAKPIVIAKPTKKVASPAVVKTKTKSAPIAKPEVAKAKAPKVEKTKVAAAPSKKIDKKELKAALNQKPTDRPTTRITRSAKDLPRKKSSLRNVISDEVSFDMPAPKQNKELILSKEEKLKIKKILLNKCIEIQKNNIALAKVAMEEALANATSEKGSEGEGLSDSYRETMHATRDMHARQVHDGTNTLALLNRIQIQEHDWVKFGSVIITDYQNYFISSGLGEITINDEAFITVSTLSPLFQILASKEKGAQFMFLDRMYKVLEVF
jgi:hypothetical protein